MSQALFYAGTLSSGLYEEDEGLVSINLSDAMNSVRVKRKKEKVLTVSLRHILHFQLHLCPHALCVEVHDVHILVLCDWAAVAWIHAAGTLSSDKDSNFILYVLSATELKNIIRPACQRTGYRASAARRLPCVVAYSSNTR